MKYWRSYLARQRIFWVGDIPIMTKYDCDIDYDKSDCTFCVCAYIDIGGIDVVMVTVHVSRD